MSVPRIVAVIVVFGAALAASPAPASAELAGQEPPVPTTTSQPPVSTRVCDAPMPFRGEFEGRCADPATGDDSGPSTSPWSFFFAALAWVVVPLGLAVAVASSRRQSVVIAVVLTLVLGWIGFVLVYGFLGRPRPDATASYERVRW